MSKKVKFPYDYKCFHLDGAHVTMTAKPTPETIEALRKMIALAKQMKSKYIKNE